MPKKIIYLALGMVLSIWGGSHLLSLQAPQGYPGKLETITIGRIDKGIKNEADLRGKKIGLPRRTVAEFYLDRFLGRHGLSVRDVTLINLTPKQAVRAIADGTVDTVVVWEPYASHIQGQQANRIVSWSVQNGQAQYSVLSGRNDWIKLHPKLVKKVLNALNQAEEYINGHTAEAKDILKERYRHDDAYIARVWPELRFSLSLDQALVLALADEASWMIKNNPTAKKTVPNFLDYMYDDALGAIKPGAVNIIR